MRLAASSRGVRGWRGLVLLHLLLLGGVLLLELLGLLGVALFHLLFLLVVVVFLGGLLVFFFLLLLELLVLLVLLGGQLVLLLLVFFVGGVIAAARRGVFVFLYFIGVPWIGGASCRARFVAVRGIGWRRVVCATGVFGGYHVVMEFAGPGGGGDGRLAMVGGGAQFGIAAGSCDMLRLRGYWADVAFAGVGALLLRFAGFHATGAAIVADVSIHHGDP